MSAEKPCIFTKLCFLSVYRKAIELIFFVVTGLPKKLSAKSLQKFLKVRAGVRVAERRKNLNVSRKLCRPVFKMSSGKSLQPSGKSFCQPWPLTNWGFCIFFADFENPYLSHATKVIKMSRRLNTCPRKAKKLQKPSCWRL